MSLVKLVIKNLMDRGMTRKQAKEVYNAGPKMEAPWHGMLAGSTRQTRRAALRAHYKMLDHENALDARISKRRKSGAFGKGKAADQREKDFRQAHQFPVPVDRGGVPLPGVRPIMDTISQLVDIGGGIMDRKTFKVVGGYTKPNLTYKPNGKREVARRQGLKYTPPQFIPMSAKARFYA